MHHIVNRNNPNDGLKVHFYFFPDRCTLKIYSVQCNPTNKKSWPFLQVNSGNEQNIIYDKVEINEGNGYNVANGRFKAPYGGTYLIYISAG